MKLKNNLYFIALLVLFSCRTSLSLQKVVPEKNTKIDQNIAEKKAIVDVVMPYKKELDTKMNTPISYTETELSKAGDNGKLGILLSDFTLAGAKEWAKDNGNYIVDAAVINSGGLRNNISAGNILLKNIYEVMPFENELVLVKMKYENMLELFDYYVKYQKNNPVSGLYIEVENNQLKKALINGNELDKNKTYYIATSDFLAYGGDDMKFFNKGEIIPTGIKLRDLYIDFFKKNPVIKVNQETRLLFKK